MTPSGHIDVNGGNIVQQVSAIWVELIHGIVEEDDFLVVGIAAIL